MTKFEDMTADELRTRVDSLTALLAETTSCISCYFNDVTMDDVIRADGHELWRRCMVELGHDQAYIDGLKRPNLELGRQEERKAAINVQIELLRSNDTLMWTYSALYFLTACVDQCQYDVLCQVTNEAEKTRRSMQFQHIQNALKPVLDMISTRLKAPHLSPHLGMSEEDRQLLSKCN